MLLWGDVYPGAKVLEIGSGPGALTLALLRALGPEGCLVTVEIRRDHCEMAKGNVRRFMGTVPNWMLAQADAYVGLPIQTADRVFVDLPEPWRVLTNVRKTLRVGGVLVCYIPTVLQVKSLVDEIKIDNMGNVVAIKKGKESKKFETLLRTTKRPLRKAWR